LGKPAEEARERKIRLPEAAKQLIELYRFKGAGIDKSRNLLFFQNINISYTYIPKNACSTLKGTLASTDERYDPSQSIGLQERLFRNYPLSAHIQAKKIIAFRDPFKRIVSAYLNKILNPTPAPFVLDVCISVFKDQRHLADAKITEEILTGARPTFLEFVRYLSCRSDEEINEHWRSQLSFCVFTDYNEIFLVDNLTDLWEKSSLSHIQLSQDYTKQATSYKKKVVRQFVNDEITRQIHNIELNRLLPAGHDSEIFPHYSLFFQDEETKKLFCDRFADDIFLYNSIIRHTKQA
jgi:hypothetical protein